MSFRLLCDLCDLCDSIPRLAMSYPDPNPNLADSLSIRPDRLRASPAHSKASAAPRPAQLISLTYKRFQQKASMGTTVENQWHASRNITGHDPEDEKEKKRIGKIDKVRQTIKRSS